MTEATATVASVVLDCKDVDVMVGFWGELLGLEARTSYPGFTWMNRMSEGGQALAFQRVPERKTVKNRMHLDLSSADPDGFVDRVVHLGGSRLDEHEIAGFRWIVCADPEGNEFCVGQQQ